MDLKEKAKCERTPRVVSRAKNGKKAKNSRSRMAE
jgi:hypothetical protein